MGYLSEVFTNYYNTDDKKHKNNLKEGFRNIIWKSVPYIKLNRFFKYKISYDNIDNKNDIKILEDYQFIEYKILKSRYNINNLNKEDLVKARINSNYGKYFDNEIYYKKEYYRALAEYKNIYFNYLKDEISNLEYEIEKNNVLIEQLKIESLNNKFTLSWDDYKSFVDMCFDKIFDNYIPIDDKIERGNFTPNNILDWDEDNYILGYINKSLNGYLKNYINELKGNRKEKKYKKCEICGKCIEIKNIKNTSQRYCNNCKEEIEKENKRKWWSVTRLSRKC